MAKRKSENRHSSVKHQSVEQDQTSFAVDTGKLPAWPVFMAINLSYAESKAWLEHALGADDLGDDFINMGFKFHFTNPTTGERRVVVQRGGEDQKSATVLSWGIAVSILTLIRLQGYTATYGESGVVGLYFSFGGDDKRKSDMDRFMLLLEERPEFSMLNLSHDLEEVTDDKGSQAKDSETKEANLPTAE